MKKYLIKFFAIFIYFICSNTVAFGQVINDNDTQATVRLIAKHFLKHRRPTFRGDSYMPNVVWVSGIDTLENSTKAKVVLFRTHKEARFFITPLDTIGSDRIRISYIEEQGYLFLWYDFSMCLTQDVLDVLTRYKFCEFRTESPECLFCENQVNDDGGGNIAYMFDLTLPSKFKRRITKAFE